MRFLYKTIGLLIASVGLMIIAETTYASSNNEKNKIHVSTMGLPFFVKEKEKSSVASYSIYRIESIIHRDKFLHYLVGLIEESQQNETQINMIYRILSVRKYSKELVYVIMSPTKKNIRIEQPYFYKGTKKLIFESGVKENKEPHHLYIRSYVVDKDKDKYIKTVTVNGHNIDLKAGGL